MLGERQWTWLEEQLAAPADVRILGSSLQVLADFAGWEGWVNYAHDHQRLFQAIRAQKANNLICISGDTHYGEVSKLETNTPYPIWDFTSSGLTEVWPVTPPNARRVGEVYRAENFGLLSIDWNTRRSVTAEVRGMDGKPQLSQQVFLDSLQVKA
jgi:alkaline phosphatase D